MGLVKASIIFRSKVFYILLLICFPQIFTINTSYLQNKRPKPRVLFSKGRRQVQRLGKLLSPEGPLCLLWPWPEGPLAQQKQSYAHDVGAEALASRTTRSCEGSNACVWFLS